MRAAALLDRYNGRCRVCHDAAVFCPAIDDAALPIVNWRNAPYGIILNPLSSTESGPLISAPSNGGAFFIFTVPEKSPPLLSADGLNSSGAVQCTGATRPVAALVWRDFCGSARQYLSLHMPWRTIAISASGDFIDQGVANQPRRLVGNAVDAGGSGGRCDFLDPGHNPVSSTAGV